MKTIRVLPYHAHETRVALRLSDEDAARLEKLDTNSYIVVKDHLNGAHWRVTCGAVEPWRGVPQTERLSALLRRAAERLHEPYKVHRYYPFGMCAAVYSICGAASPLWMFAQMHLMRLRPQEGTSTGVYWYGKPQPKSIKLRNLRRNQRTIGLLLAAELAEDMGD